MDNRIHLADIGKELISESLPFGSALHKPRDIHKFDHRRRHFLRPIKLSEQPDPLIRHCHNPHIRVDRTERIVGGFCARLGQ